MFFVVAYFICSIFAVVSNLFEMSLSTHVFDLVVRMIILVFFFSSNLISVELVRFGSDFCSSDKPVPRKNKVIIQNCLC